MWNCVYENFFPRQIWYKNMYYDILLPTSILIFAQCLWWKYSRESTYINQSHSRTRKSKNSLYCRRINISFKNKEERKTMNCVIHDDNMIYIFTIHLLRFKCVFFYVVHLQQDHYIIVNAECVRLYLIVMYTVIFLLYTFR